MENKTTEIPLSADPILVDAIIEVLSKEVEAVKELLDRKNLLEKN